MRLLIQRVSEAAVKVEERVIGQIEEGLLVFLGIGEFDDEEDIDWLIKKLINLRIFNDENNVMNLSISDISGEILIVSQFTLLASTKKGNRPSYINAAKPQTAEEIYHTFVKKLRFLYSGKVEEGKFAADMKVSLINNGPVTIWIDSKNKE